jgi:cobalamin biosynthesis protein CobD/CbiB
MKRKLKATPLMMILFKDVNLLEHDAATQYKFNRFWAFVWGSSIVCILFVPKLYAHSISVLLVQEISLWANFATHFGAMSAALAANNTSTKVSYIAENVADVSGDVDDIKDDVSKVAEVVAG